MTIKTPYVPHIFGDEVSKKFRSRRGWLTAGVASSISWPSQDVCVTYAGDDYFLRGSELDGNPAPPGITVACPDGSSDEAIAKVYRFTSILSWYMGGYVDVSGYISGSHPILYGNPRTVYSTLGIAGKKSFNCNHLPIIEDESRRKALAFWREGQRLREVHDSYAFLSFYKVVESQFSDSKSKVEWITTSIGKLTDRAAKRVKELRDAGLDVGRHLFESGRCAIAHASLEGEIIDPDVPEDRKRLSADLIVIEELARIFIRDELQIPDSMSLYRNRNRLSPWDGLLSTQVLNELKSGETPDDFAGYEGKIADVGLWPDGPIPGLDNMSIHVASVYEGIVRLELTNRKKTILLPFIVDYRSGRLHADLDNSGLLYESDALDAEDVRAFATFFYKVLGNGIAELTLDGIEPVDCEVVIPVNIMPPNPDEAIAETIRRFIEQRDDPDAPKKD